MTSAPKQDGQQPYLYSITTAQAVLGGMGRTWLYKQIHAGRVRTKKLGRRTMLIAEDVHRLAQPDEVAA